MKSWFSTAYKPNQDYPAPRVYRFTGLNNLDFSEVKNASYMFCGVAKHGLSEESDKLVNLSLPKAVDVSAMFCCSHVEKLFGSGDVSLTLGTGLEASESLILNYLFQNSKDLESLNLSTSDLSKVKATNFMFCGCSDLQTKTDKEALVLPTENSFNFLQLKELVAMFCDCDNKNLYSIDFSTVAGAPDSTTSMSNMFNSCTNLVQIYAPNNADWSQCGNSKYMFSACNNLHGASGTSVPANANDITLAKVDKGIGVGVKQSDETYKYDREQEGLLSDVRTRAVLKEGTLTFCIDRKYYGVDTCYTVSDDATKIQNLNNIPWHKIRADVQHVVFNNSFKAYKPGQTAWWFESCTNVTDFKDEGSSTLNKITNLDISQMTNPVGCESMFNSISSFEGTLDLSALKCSGIKNTQWMFCHDTQIKGVKMFGAAGSDDYANNTTTTNMFDGCSSLETLENINKIVRSNTTSISGMFTGCGSLKSVDVSGWSLSSQITSLEGFFKNCTSLTSIDLSGWNTSNITSLKEFCMGCTNLETFTGPCTYDKNGNKTVTSLGSGCNCSSICEGCTQLNEFDFYYCNITTVTNFSKAFYKDTSLLTVDFSNGLPGNGVSQGCLVDNMFDSADGTKNMALQRIYVQPEGNSSDNPNTTSWAYFTKESSSSNMFYNCSNLKGSETYTCPTGIQHNTLGREDRSNAKATGYGTQEGVFSRASLSRDGSTPSRYTLEEAAKTKSGGTFANGLENGKYYRIVSNTNSNYELNINGGSGAKILSWYKGDSQNWRADIDSTTGLVRFVNNQDGSMLLNLRNGNPCGAENVQSWGTGDTSLASSWVVKKLGVNRYSIASAKDAYLALNVDGGAHDKAPTVWYNYTGGYREFNLVKK